MTDVPVEAPDANDAVAERVLPGGEPAPSAEVTPVDAGLPAPPAPVSSPEAGVEPESSLFAFTVSNLDPNEYDLPLAEAATLNCGATQIDTSGDVSFDNWCGTPPAVKLQQQPSGPELAVIALSALSLDAQSSLRVTGSRPLVLLVGGGVDVAGTIDLSAAAETPGAGGDQLCAESLGGDGLGRARRNGGGGGGGGFGSPGGRGGNDDDDDAIGGAPGGARGNAELSPLLGGCAGGRGGGCEGNPGAGGGALQISAGESLVVRGRIAANGGVGAQGCGNDAGGTGGGSGGAVLLEAQDLDVSSAVLEAAGGAGGAARRRADGGPGAATEQDAAADGEEGRGNGAGGGGGGFGRIHLRGASTCTGC